MNFKENLCRKSYFFSLYIHCNYGISLGGIMGKRFLCLILAILIAFSAVGCSKEDLGNARLFDAGQTSDADTFEDLTDDWFCRQMEADPMSCHFTLENPDAYHITFSDQTLCTLTMEEHIKEMDAIKNLLDRLKDIDRNNLTARQRLVYDLMKDYYGLEEKLGDYYYYQNLLSPTAGIPSSLPVLLSSFSFHDTEDIECYLSLLEEMDIYFGQIYAFATEQTKLGLMENTDSLQQTIDFCASFSQVQADHLLLTSFDDRIKNAAFLDEAEKASYISRNQSIIYDVVLPSYLSLSNQLSSIIDKTDDNGSLSVKEKGRTYYALLVRKNTGTKESPYTVFQEIAAKRQEDLFQMADLFAHNPALASMLGSYTCPLKTPDDMIEHLQDSIQNDFPACENVTVTIHEIAPQLRQTSAPAYYLIAPLDSGGYHNIFYNPDSNADTTSLFTTMAHEGFPGHLYQTAMSYQYGLEPVRALLSFPAYTEGWATYVEYMSYQYAGLPDQLASVLALNESIVLSLYASADIGIHYYGWDRASLLEFLENYGIKDQDVVDQIYQLIVEDPANYLHYYVGYMNFASLQKDYKDAKKDDFSYMEFHKKILQTGPAPFDILRDALLGTS